MLGIQEVNGAPLNEPLYVWRDSADAPIVVPPDRRTMTLKAEQRDLIVPAETRTMILPEEPRVMEAK